MTAHSPPVLLVRLVYLSSGEVAPSDGFEKDRLAETPLMKATLCPALILGSAARARGYREMVSFALGSLALMFLVLCTLPASAVAQQTKSSDQLPDAIRGAKIYKLSPKENQPQPNLGIYKKLSFRDINFERLQFALSVAI